MNIELKHFNLIDSTVMFGRLSQIEREVYEALSGLEFDPQEATMAIFNAAGIHFTWMFGDEVVAVGGFIRHRPGVLRTWFAAPDDTWTKCGPEITKSCRDLIAGLLKDGKAHRIETITLERHNRAWMWYQKIGLAREAILKKFAANGEDAVMYVATKESE